MSKKSHAKHEAKHKKPKHHSATKPESIAKEDIFSEHKTGSEIIIALLIFGLGIFFMVPIYSALTAPGQLALLVIFMLAIFLFAALHWRRGAPLSSDPAEVHPSEHLIGQFVYISALALLSIAIIIQFFSGGVDLWLVAILVLLVLIKVFVSSHFKRK